MGMRHCESHSGGVDAARMALASVSHPHVNDTEDTEDCFSGRVKADTETTDTP